MDSENANLRQKLRGDYAITPLSRRTFLSSLTATGAAVMLSKIAWASSGMLQGNETPPACPALPPPPGHEASYEWYLKQYSDPTIFTPVGLPADPAETAVLPNGELLRATDLYFFGTGRLKGPIRETQYFRNSLAFALYDGTRIVPIGTGGRAQQSLENSCIPIVITRWQHGDLEIRQTTFSEPLRGVNYQSGLESTLAWAVFEVTNHGSAACPVTLLSSLMGDEEESLKLDLSYTAGVVMDKGGALFSAQLPSGFSAEFHPVFPPAADPTAASGKADHIGLLWTDVGVLEPLEFLRRYEGVFNTLAVQGRIEAGKTVQIAFNRRLDFPDAYFWGPIAQAVVAPEELTRRSPENALTSARATWDTLGSQVSPFKTPEAVLNNIVNKAMLDGYFLTKRWNGKYIVFDSVRYRCQWDDSSTKWFYALDLMGDHVTSERLLDTVFTRQGQRIPAGIRTHEGCFSDVTNTEQDDSKSCRASCNGWALWAMAEHARLADDRDWIQKHKQQILDGCEWIRRERRFSKEIPNNTCEGLLYGKFCCDMPDQGEVSGIGYFAYTDAISYMGLHEIGELLAEWGHPEGDSLLREAELYRNDIITAIDRLTDKSQDPWYIPFDLSVPKYVARYFYDCLGPINLAYARVFPPNDERTENIIRWIIDRTHHGSLEEATAGITKPNEGTMFHIQDLAIVLLELGRVEDFLRIFYTLLASNISHETLTTCEWGTNTQPHIHSIAALIRMFRTMMIQERDGRLYLLQGTPRQWLEDGNTVKITEAPSWYGPLSLETTSNIRVNEVRTKLVIPERLGSRPLHLRLRLPNERHIKKARVNGHEHSDVEGEWIILKGFIGAVEIVVETT